jgi:biotin transport system ATP-binding protein
MKPRVLLLDEPFTGIDIPTQRKLEQYLSSIKQTIIHVSHVPETFENYQRLIWMDEGVVQADGKPRTVIKKYKDAMKNYVEMNV